MSNLKPWIANPPLDFAGPTAFVQSSVPAPDAGSKLLSGTPGRYATTVPTKAGGAGELKPFAAPPAWRHSPLKPSVSPYTRGCRGSDPVTEILLRNTPRNVVPSS
jgi:hypothetical protein